MIRNVVNSSPFVNVYGEGGYAPHISMNNVSAGMVRYNGLTKNFEVYDGITWITVPTSVASVGLTDEAVSLLEWAREKRNEEARLKALADKHPGIKDLKEKLDIMVALVKDYNETR